MPDRLPTVWDIDPHTKAKHFILKRHLGGWFPILSRWHGRIVYLDGFAGPGKYRGGEDGSPVIAIRTAIDHRFPLADEVVFYFIEARPDRKAHLEQVLPEIFPKPPANVSWHVSGARFADEMRALLTTLEEEGQRLAPTFAFLDPFGFSGMPMEIVARILNYPRCEALITFMAAFVNRFAETDFNEETLDELFGTRAWRTISELKKSEQRRRFLIDLYVQQIKLRVQGIHVRAFEMVDARNITIYYLVFATRSEKGMEVMKGAMWGADPTGQYRFSDRTDPNQQTLLNLEDEDAWVGPAANMVHGEFLGTSRTVEQVMSFVILRTPFPPHRKILKRLEQDGNIHSVRGRQRAGTFPDGCLIRFT
jgi:three-Cys-motif partner protein